jgi:hypothetical protein
MMYWWDVVEYGSEIDVRADVVIEDGVIRAEGKQ